MPKFSDAEKEIIKQKLMQEGERLFTSYGIKKVTIDEIVQAAGIAKGSFYSFYSNTWTLPEICSLKCGGKWMRF